MNLRLPTTVLTAGLFLTGAQAVAHDRSHHDHHDQEAARAAVQSGAIKPLYDILGRVRTQIAGDIVKVRLGRDDGRWIYEFRVIDANGRLSDVQVDAADGTIVDAGRR
jgi:uncharacterized membrane protein YkoI